MAMYFGPVILLTVIWYLYSSEIIKEVPNEKNLKFFKVITIMFAVMQVFTSFLAIGTTANAFILFTLIIVSIVITLTIVLPYQTLPNQYQVFIQKLFNKQG